MAAEAGRLPAVVLCVMAALVSGCAPRKAPLTLDASVRPDGVARAAAHGLAVSVLPWDEAAERRAFGMSLRRSAVRTVEVRFERSGGVSSAFKVRRTGIRARFADGSARDALDPGEVYQRNHLDPNRGGLVAGLQLFGETPSAVLGGPGVEDQRRRVVFGSSAFAVAAIDDARPVAVGLLFFDVAGLGDARPAAIQVEFEDSTGGAIRSLEVPIPVPASVGAHPALAQ
jgi:hypothetical protein